MKSRYSLFRFGAVIAAAVLCGGCVRKSVEGGTTIFSFESWVPLCALAACLAAIPAGWMLREKVGRLGWGLVIIAPILLVVMVPGLFLDRVTVDDEHFTLRTGFWFTPTRHDVRFDELAEIRITSETRSTRRGRRTSYFLDCRSRSGGIQKVPVGNVMDEAVDTIFDVADRKGIPIVNATN